MKPESEMLETLENELSAWAIPLGEPEPEPVPTAAMPSNLVPELQPTLLPLRLEELPSEGFAPRLRRFDEVA